MSDDQLLWAFGLWVHWIMPVLFVVMFLCGVMAIYQSVTTKHVPSPPETGSPEKEAKGSCPNATSAPRAPKTCPNCHRPLPRSTRRTCRGQR